MSDRLEIELFNKLPEFLFGNKKYLLVQGAVKNFEGFKNCTLLINQKVIATVKPSVTYNPIKQKVCSNVFQFLVELPSFKNEKFINLALKIHFEGNEVSSEIAKIPIKKITKKCNFYTR